MAPPYRIGKGPIVVALEQFLAVGDVATWYEQLADEATYLTASTPTVFEKFLANVAADHHEHLENDVFGPGQATAQLSPEEAEEAAQKGMSRRLVYGRGFRRALELAYGFGEASPRAGGPWAVDVFWGCGQPFNLVALATNPAARTVTVIVYSDEVATGAEAGTVVASDATKPLTPDRNGDLFFVDDRAGLGAVKEWRATTAIGFAGSPPGPSR